MKEKNGVVKLLNPSGSVVDALQYGNAGTWNAGEGKYAVDVSAGWSLSRNLFGSDTNDNATDFTGLGTPTPGAGPCAPVPEPGTLVLLSGGTVGLLAVRRRRGRRQRAVADSRQARSSMRARAQSTAM